MAGLWIAFNVSTGDRGGTSAFLTGGILFIPVALLTAFGALLVVRSGKKQETMSGIHVQRQLLELVKGKGQVSVDKVASDLGTTSDAVVAMIHELVELRVFSGYMNWDKGILCSLPTKGLRTLERCETCSNMIRISDDDATKVCISCGTEYFLV